MEHLQVVVIYLYIIIFLFLSLFGLHRFYLVLTYHRCKAKRNPTEIFQSLPLVTVQLPIYNEANVTERLIDAVCKIDYPRDRVEIQVLDDSVDETRKIARQAVSRWKKKGVDIVYIHRTHRQGFKAGALANGLKSAKGEFIAIFDADFIPHPSFLMKTIHPLADKEIGMVQARWDYVNRNYSLLTRVQAILLDGHFVIEHGARHCSGRFFNFNGTAGIWRKACIEDAGGWQHDTLTEDLDLSYRAQLKGWHFRYLPDVTVLSELPVEMNGFKNQQHRWAKGSAQTARKLLGRILREPIPLKLKIEALFHLTGNSAYLGISLLALILYPAILARTGLGWPAFWIMIMDGAFFIITFSSILVFYIYAQREVQQNLILSILLLPLVMSVGIGISLNNAKAVVEALLGYKTPFVRTPKYRVENETKGRKLKHYQATRNWLPFLEGFLGLYFVGILMMVTHEAIYSAIPFLLLFLIGFLYTAFMSLFQDRLLIRSAATPFFETGHSQTTS